MNSVPDITTIVDAHPTFSQRLLSFILASHEGDSKIILDEGKLSREAKDILDNLVITIPVKKANISMGWSIQIGGCSCFY